MALFKPSASSAKLLSFSIVLSSLLIGCGSSSGSDSNSDSDSSNTDDTNNIESSGDTIDITNSILTATSADCDDYVNDYEASVSDIQRSLSFEPEVSITSSSTTCTLTSDSIPNHDFNDNTAKFATDVASISKQYTITRNPTANGSSTAISQTFYNAVMLNGVVLDILSAGCYKPTHPMADIDTGNTPIGCTEADAWLLDPLSPLNTFGTDIHNAHTQPDGMYHYHGSPEALFDTNPGPNGSPVIGFAADGFPIYGSYFYNSSTGKIETAQSGYKLKSGTRASSATDPGGAHDGMYVADWEYDVTQGNLDACNGKTVNGQYGYYVTNSYPWVIKCFMGTPNTSFNKR